MPAFPKARPIELDRRAIARAKAAQWATLTKYVRAREKGACRLCRKPGAEVHHIEFRSRGGKDVASDAVLLCKTCHEDAHKHIVKLAGDAQKKRGLKVARWSDRTSDYVWGPV